MTPHFYVSVEIDHLQNSQCPENEVISRKSKIVPDAKSRENFLLGILPNEILHPAMYNVLSPHNRKLPSVGGLFLYCVHTIWRRVCTKLHFPGLYELL